MELGTMLRKQREKKKLSQDEIAHKVGVSQSTYQAWESGHTRPKAIYYAPLATALSIDIKDLIPLDMTVALQSPNGSTTEPTILNAHALYNDLTSSQKHVIELQKQRIAQLKRENQQLREQLTQKD